MIFVHRLQRDKYAEPMNGIPKGLCSFGGVQRQRLWSGQGQTALAGSGQSPEVTQRSARVNPENNPVNCFRERDALQERASLNGADDHISPINQTSRHGAM